MIIKWELSSDVFIINYEIIMFIIIIMVVVLVVGVNVVLQWI